MGSLENALLLAQKVGDTVKTVQGPLDVTPMTNVVIRPKFTELQTQGPNDLWWKHVVLLYDDCMRRVPDDCRTLEEYAHWAEDMLRFWHTILSAREMLVAWAGVDPGRFETKLMPNDNLISVRNPQPSNDFPKDGISPIETIGNETMDRLKERGIDCFEPWSREKYKSYFTVAGQYGRAKVLYHEAKTSAICGFYSWNEKPPRIPPSAILKERTIGSESIRTRTLWKKEITPERIGFRHVPNTGLPSSILEDEAMLRIALDLIKVSIHTKFPLVLPNQRTVSP